jgi:hypothetical protein
MVSSPDLIDTILCARCARPLEGLWSFAIGGARCTRCALRYGPLLRRSALTALVVGTVLVAINQGNILLGGSFPVALLWKIPLTYCVPFCVATWGALINSRR